MVRGSVMRLAYGAVRGVLTDGAVRRLFLIYFVAFLANQMSRPIRQPLRGTPARLAR